MDLGRHLIQVELFVYALHCMYDMHVMLYVLYVCVICTYASIYTCVVTSLSCVVYMYYVCTYTILIQVFDHTLGFIMQELLVITICVSHAFWLFSRI